MYKAAEGNMDINKILAGLRAERDDIKRAIAALYRLRGGGGRPPKWMNQIAKTKQKKKQSKKPQK